MKKNYLLLIVGILFFSSSYGLTIDGNLNDWKKIEPVVTLNESGQLSELPGNWQGPIDLSGSFYLSQDSDNLYIAAVVHDDKPLWEPRGYSVQDPWWKITYDGDAVRVKIMFTSSTTDLFLFPGAYGVNPEIYIHRSNSGKSGKLSEGEIASSYAIKFSGYILETRIPKSALGNSGESPIFEFELFDSDGPASTCKSLKSKIVSIPGGK